MSKVKNGSELQRGRLPRRGVIFGLGGLVAVGAADEVADKTETKTAKTADEARSKSTDYRETDHVRTYYALARR